MSSTDFCDKKSFSLRKNTNEVVYDKHMSSVQSSDGDVNDFLKKGHANEENSRLTGNWCDALSSLSNVNAKQAWKSGTEKLSQTFNNVRTTFGVLSQRIKKSTKKRQPLINLDSPRTPVTPYARSRAALGRTPTKLYSPFSIDTPTGKENTDRFHMDPTQSSNGSSIKESKKKPRRTRLDLGVACGGTTSSNTNEPFILNDLLQTQIGIYEFHSVANRIVQNGLNK